MEENEQIDAVSVLYDAMDNVCKFLHLKDLNVLAKVCKSWRDAASRELSRRCYIQQLRLPFKIGHPSQSWTPVLSEMLDVNPRVTLLFYDSGLYEPALRRHPFSYWVEEELIVDFKQNLRGRSAVLRVCEFLTTENVELEGTRGADRTGNLEPASSGFLGMFFPSMEKRLRVDVAWMDDYYGVDDQSHYIAKKLGLNDCERPKSTLLIFAYSLEGFKIADALVTDRIDDGKESVWAVGFDKRLMALDYRYAGHRSEKCIVALKLSGPSVESWCTLIDWPSRSDEVERKLRELRERLRSKRHATGLLSAPHADESDSGREIMRSAKRVFPNIPFVGLFNRCSWVQPATRGEMKSNLDPRNQEHRWDKHLWHKNLYISVIIIGHD